MTTLVYTHRSSLRHETPPGHPERVDRIKAVYSVLDAPHFAAAQRREAPGATEAQLLLAHTPEHVQRIFAVAPESGFEYLDADTVMSAHSLEAALRAAGAATAAVDAVFRAEASNAFCALRPPGHHAEQNKAMGFCLFNQAAIAALHARTRYDAERVAVVDFDVHHGNGTQDIFWADKSVMYCSTHQMPLFPGSGAASERGDHDTIVNAPLVAEDGGAEFHAAFEQRILPRLNAFAPELIVISAGFDAHHLDPLANINLYGSDFRWVTQQLMEVADKHAGGRVVSVLEGGYDLEGLRESVDAHVTTLMRG